MKTISRQRLFQIKQNNLGLCAKCRNKLSPDSPVFCQEHLDYHRENCRINYRLRAGIPLDAPAYSHYAGRPVKKK